MAARAPGRPGRPTASASSLSDSSRRRAGCCAPSATATPRARWSPGSCTFTFFFTATATTEIYTLSLHDALPILRLKFARKPIFQIRAEQTRPGGIVGAPLQNLEQLQVNLGGQRAVGQFRAKFQAGLFGELTRAEAKRLDIFFQRGLRRGILFDRRLRGVGHTPRVRAAIAKE